MTSFRGITLVVALAVTVVLAAGAGVAVGQSRTVGQTIDDTVITTEIKAKLAADQLSNLTKIGVSTKNGVVTLSGTVDSLERQERAVQIAGSVKGVRGVVNSIQLAGTPAPGSTATAPAPVVDATGVVARVDPSTGTITLQDGRVLRTNPGTMIWQPTTVQALRPGTQVLVRGAAPIGVDRAATAPAPEWRMGTVRTVDSPTSQIVLTDNTVVRVAPSAYLHRDAERLALEQIAPGSEVVIRPLATSPTLDAAEINVVWAPSASLR